MEGTFGNRYRWIGSRAIARLRRVHSVPVKLRIRGFAPETMFAVGKPRIEAVVNGVVVREWALDRVGLFLLEADVDGTENDFTVELRVAPEWRAPGDARALTVNISMVRLVPRD